MGSLSRWLKMVRGAVRVAVLLLPLSVVLVPILLRADAPAWWTERGVLVPGATPDDYAVVNQGQLKHIAKQAYEEFDAKLSGGAGSALDALWALPAVGTDDYSAINLGQLKNVAEPFYARLEEVGYTGQARPWSGIGADDYALANIGQVKNLFSFDLGILATIDQDNGGFPDFWERYHFGVLGVSLSADSDGDGLSNLTEFTAGTDPLAQNNNNSVRLSLFAPSAR